MRTVFHPSKRVKRVAVLVLHTLTLVAIGMFVLAGSSGKDLSDKKAALSANLGGSSVSAIDELSSADVAVNVALLTNLEEAVAVVNQADTVNSQLAVTPSDDKVVSKPQVIDPTIKRQEDISVYTVQPGDSVDSVAQKFGITANTVRWSNGITGNSLNAGQELVISPVNGIVYTVKETDSIESIAQKFGVSKDSLIAFNDVEISGKFSVGERIVIPDGIQPAPLRNFAFASFKASYGYNGYSFGYCTWYAALRRAQTGRPIPSNLGNAVTWLELAQRAGIPTGKQPKAGAVIWTPVARLPSGYYRNYGHVGFVEEVNPDGSVLISEMNVAGWNRRSEKVLSPDQASNYSYIY